jgi:hypothetical protein
MACTIPAAGQPFVDKSRAQRLTVPYQEPQLASVSILLTAIAFSGDRASVQQLLQAFGGFASKISFMRAARRVRLGRIDVGDLDLDAVHPDRIAIHDAIGPATAVTQHELA